MSVPLRTIRCLLLEDSGVDAELISHQLGKVNGPVEVTRAEVRKD